MLCWAFRKITSEYMLNNIGRQNASLSYYSLNFIKYFSFNSYFCSLFLNPIGDFKLHAIISFQVYLTDGMPFYIHPFVCVYIYGYVYIHLFIWLHSELWCHILLIFARYINSVHSPFKESLEPLGKEVLLGESGNHSTALRDGKTLRKTYSLGGSRPKWRAELSP